MSLPDSVIDIISASFQCVATNDHVYVLEGKYDVYLKYSIDTDTWMNFDNNMVYSHIYGSVSMRNDEKIYIAGGCENDYTTNISQIEVYDTKSDTWSVSSMQLPHPMDVSRSCWFHCGHTGLL